MLVASIQMNSQANICDNLQAARVLIQKAAEQGAKLVVLPEMFALMGVDQHQPISYYENEGDGQIQTFLREMALECGIWLVGGTLPIASEPAATKAYAACLVYNAAGQLVARYDKIHLFDVKVGPAEAYSESRTMVPGLQSVLFDSPLGKIGLAVCYDLRFPELFRQLSAKGADIIIIPAAFTAVTGALHWEILVRARAIENLAYVITACQTGSHGSKRNTYGHSMIIDPWGAILAAQADQPGVIMADLDLDKLAQLRNDFPALKHRKL